MNLDTIRNDLCLDPGIAYLDKAAASVMPRQVLQAVTGYLERTATTGPYLPSFRRETYARLEEIRASTAAFIADFEMLSNLTPWLLLQQTRRILVRTVVSNAHGLLEPLALAALMTPRTR